MLPLLGSLSPHPHQKPDLLTNTAGGAKKVCTLRTMSIDINLSSSMFDDLICPLITLFFICRILSKMSSSRTPSYIF